MKNIKSYLTALLLTAGIMLPSCSDDKAVPPLPSLPVLEGVTDAAGNPKEIGNGEWDNPFTAWQALLGTPGQETSGMWVTGYIVGWIDTTVGTTLTEASAKFTVPATTTTNILIANTPTETDWEKCAPVQLPSSVRDALSLGKAENQGKLVSLYGTTGRTYCGTYGVRDVSQYKWGAEGVFIPKPVIVTSHYRKATSVEAGKTYSIVCNGTAAQNITKDFGYLYVTAVNISDGEFTYRGESIGFTFEAAEGGFRIKQDVGTYLWMDGTYNNFQTSTAPSGDTALWTAEPQADGTFKITNVGKQKFIQYYTAGSSPSFGSYSTAQYPLPELYELVEK